MDLHDTVLDMRRVAREFPHDLRENVIAPKQGLRDVEFEGLSLKIFLTYEIVPDFPKPIWHLSVGQNETTAPDDITQKIVEAFLDGSGKILELPIKFGPLRQFIQVIE